MAFIFTDQQRTAGTLTQAPSSATITPNTTYTLSAAVGQAIASLGRPFPGYEITLLAGASTVLATESKLVTPAPGTFETR